MSNILVTGITIGLGKFLHRELNTDGWHRGEVPDKHYETIIHCAHSKTHQENADMLQRLFSVPCDKFVYISSIDVYNAFNLMHDGYALSKLRCEQFVRQSYSNHLIIRVGAMVGRDARPNSIIKAIKGEKLTVSPKARFGYVQHKAIINYLHLCGNINISGNVKQMRDIIEELGLAAPEYGEFPYNSPEVKPTHDTIEQLKQYIHDLVANPQ